MIRLLIQKSFQAILPRKKREKLGKLESNQNEICQKDKYTVMVSKFYRLSRKYQVKIKHLVLRFSVFYA